MIVSMMGRCRMSVPGFFFPVCVLVMVALSFVQLVQCQYQDDYSGYDNPAVLPLITQLVNDRLTNMTTVLSGEISNRSNFCIKDPDGDWHQAFNFSDNLDFLSSCIKKTRGDVTRRLCTAAEIKFYFSNFFEQSGGSNYLKPNKNCNLTSWVSGCEPGWSCTVAPNEDVDLKNSHNMPVRTRSCQPCCEGFFCPHGITCMIPCPLGSYCPLATLNKTTGVCEPYLYQLPPGQTNHTCGGANIWADVGTSSELFCSAGSYCPTTTQKIPCSSGHYCRRGSTSETRCFKLTSCNPNTEKQNIHAYGIMLIAALSTLLLIIYNCSDYFLTNRERSLAKSRDRAAKSARENARRKSARKGDTGVVKTFINNVSHKISRQFTVSHPEKSRILNQETYDDVSYLSHPSTLSTSKQSSTDLMVLMQDIEDNPDGFVGVDTGSENTEMKTNMLKGENDPNSHADLNLESEKTSMETNAPKGKQKKTLSQKLFNVYEKLEKEKENHTFSGVVSMATTTKTWRPKIEIAFKDLTLTLKGKNKHLLRCVTGKIMPGCITAVMGPSGAGKTTFLNALAGKAIGCTTTGVILVNDKHESIHSYKKIIGFVPQDDIVHGNLTVQENLVFSARCRLSADLQREDRTLVIERVIESLGLQAVSDSLVGTVEKRGISGGQRKRVNVGLEMVMEPSLLILDEPTSGLDSSSSLLVLRALRREARAGVNICMVVHQPSYALFNMFDELLLLAKGGLTVYHGPVKQVEAYFEDLGISIPERVNPPDHFIDILEGIAKPSASSVVNYIGELPVRWMLHNGYPIPPDMQQFAAALAMSSTGVSPIDVITPADAGKEDRSFAGELWQDVKCNVELQHDKIRHNFLKSKDFSNRKTPGLFCQYKYFLGRVAKQRLREAKTQAIDYLILLLAGACLGSLAKANDETFGAIGYTYTVIAVSLLCKIAALRSFSLEKLHYWRESSSGMSSLAYFLSKDTIDLFNTIIKPVVYLSTFYFFSNPRSSFADNYLILVCLVYCVTGIAYALAISLEPGPAQLCSVLLPVVLTLIATQPKDSGILKNLANLCYTKWALEAFGISNAERYYGVWLITRCGALMKNGYNLHEWNLCIFILILTGFVSRAIAFLFMLTFQKK